MNFAFSGMLMLLQRYAGDCSIIIAVDPDTVVSMAVNESSGRTNSGVRNPLCTGPIAFGVLGMPFLSSINLYVGLVSCFPSSVTVCSCGTLAALRPVPKNPCAALSVGHDVSLVQGKRKFGLNFT